MRLPACVPLLIAAGGVPSITVRETVAPMSVASIEKIAAFAVRATIAQGVTSAASGATVAKRLTSAMIVAKSLVANAAIIAVKITSARSAVIAAMTFAASGEAIVV